MEDYEDLIIQQIMYIEPREENECFVCFEIKKSEELPIRLKDQTLFLKFCNKLEFIILKRTGNCDKIFYNFK